MANIDGAFFGTRLPEIFFKQYPKKAPKKGPERFVLPDKKKGSQVVLFDIDSEEQSEVIKKGSKN